MLFRKKETIIRRSAHPYNGNFLQPLAVAIVSAVLVALILIMGFLDIRRSETNLVGFLQDQALSTISVLQRLTEDNLKSIVAKPGKSQTQLKTASQEEADYSKKLVVEAITGLGQKIDEQWKKKLINNAYLHRFATDNNFWYVAVLNRDGNAVYQSNPLKTNMLNESDLTSMDAKQRPLNCWRKYVSNKASALSACGAKDGSGTVVINLDKAGLTYWSIKVAVERGINKMGEGHGIAYMQIFNDQKKLLECHGQTCSTD